ncbi:peptidase family C54-domain-containing protein [Mycena leptocephala]|nr:peptidase family C54-domain-containing protein [Mycena leptocephala]
MEEKQKYIHAELPIQSTELLLVSTAHLLSRTRDEREDFPPGARTARIQYIISMRAHGQRIATYRSATLDRVNRNGVRGSVSAPAGVVNWRDREYKEVKTYLLKGQNTCGIMPQAAGSAKQSPTEIEMRGMRGRQGTKGQWVFNRYMTGLTRFDGLDKISGIVIGMPAPSSSTTPASTSASNSSASGTAKPRQSSRHSAAAPLSPTSSSSATGTLKASSPTLRLKQRPRTCRSDARTHPQPSRPQHQRCACDAPERVVWAFGGEQYERFEFAGDDLGIAGACGEHRCCARVVLAVYVQIRVLARQVLVVEEQGVVRHLGSGGAGKPSLLDKAVRYLLDGDANSDRSAEEIWLMGVRLPGWGREDEERLAAAGSNEKSSSSGGHSSSHAQTHKPLSPKRRSTSKARPSTSSSTSAPSSSSSNAQDPAPDNDDLLPPDTGARPAAFHAAFYAQVWCTYRAGFEPIRDLPSLASLPPPLFSPLSHGSSGALASSTTSTSTAVPTSPGMQHSPSTSQSDESAWSSGSSRGHGHGEGLDAPPSLPHQPPPPQTKRNGGPSALPVGRKGGAATRGGGVCSGRARVCLRRVWEGWDSVEGVVLAPLVALALAFAVVRIGLGTGSEAGDACAGEWSRRARDIRPPAQPPDSLFRTCLFCVFLERSSRGGLNPPPPDAHPALPAAHALRARFLSWPLDAPTDLRLTLFSFSRFNFGFCLDFSRRLCTRYSPSLVCPPTRLDGLIVHPPSRLLVRSSAGHALQSDRYPDCAWTPRDSSCNPPDWTCRRRRSASTAWRWRARPRGKDVGIPVLLLLGLRLGLDGVNPIYYETIKLLYTFPQSVGIAGGRPSSSYYFVGVQGDGLFYLDPHHSRPPIPLQPFAGAGEAPSIPLPLSSSSHGHGSHTSSTSAHSHERRSLSPEAAYARSGSMSPESGYGHAFARGVAQPRAGARARGIGEPRLPRRVGEHDDDGGRARCPPRRTRTTHTGTRARTHPAGGPMTPAEEEYFARAYTAAEMRTFHCEWVRKMPLSGLGPSMLVGFVVRDEAEWVDLRRRIKELPRTIFADEPPTWPSADDDEMGWRQGRMGVYSQEEHHGRGLGLRIRISDTMDSWVD